MTAERNVEMRKRLDGRKDCVVALWIGYTKDRKYSFISTYSLLPLNVLGRRRPILLETDSQFRHSTWSRSFGFLYPHCGQALVLFYWSVCLPLSYSLVNTPCCAIMWRLVRICLPLFCGISIVFQNSKCNMKCT